MIAIAVVVALTSGFVAIVSTWAGLAGARPVDWAGLRPLVVLPVLLTGLIIVPALFVGRLPGRLTAIDGWAWFVVAVGLFALPAAALGHVRLVELPNTTGDPDLPATISTWVVGDRPIPWVIVAAVLGGLVIAACGFAIGYAARSGSVRATIVAAVAFTGVGVGLFLGYAVMDFGSSLAAHARETGRAGTVRELPYLGWMAVPSVSVLAGAERAVVDGAD